MADLSSVGGLVYKAFVFFRDTVVWGLATLHKALPDEVFYFLIAFMLIRYWFANFRHDLMGRAKIIVIILLIIALVFVVIGFMSGAFDNALTATTTTSTTLRTILVIP